MTTSERIPLSRERLQENLLEGFAEGREKARAAREAAGLPPVSSLRGGMHSLGDVIAENRQQIADVFIRHPENLDTVDPVVLRCTRCGDAAFLRKPMANYRVDLVACPACVGADAASRRASAAGLVGRMRTKTFSSFLPRSGTEEALDVLAKWASDDATNGQAGGIKWVVLHGARGAGKTHLGLAAANLILDMGNEVRWYYTADLVDQAKSLYGADGGGEDRVLGFRREIARVPVLILDELGSAQPASEWVVRFLEALVDQRYRESLPTLFTLKAPPDQVKEHLSESIGRRMQDEELCRVVEITAGQYTSRTGQGRIA